MRASRQKGVTLIELMVAMAIGLIGVTAVLSFFLVISRNSQEQQLTGEVQQDVRMASEFLARDLRSAGFVIGGYNGIQIEQNCGDNLQTSAIKDGCPNGSDRVTIHYQIPNSRLFGCDPGTCPSNAGDHMVMQEPNALCTGGPSACGPPYPIFNGLQCGMSNVSVPVTLCDGSNINCLAAVVKSVNCDAGCGGGLGNDCVQIQFSSPSPGQLDPLRKGSPATEQLIVYQLLDVDGDGSTELVRSTNFIGNSDAVVPNVYQVVAPNIDDLQFGVNETMDAVDFRSNGCQGPACFDFTKDIYASGTIGAAVYNNGHTYGTSYNTIQADCSDGNIACTGGTCKEKVDNGPTLHWGCSEHVRGIMFQLAARTRKRVMSGNGRTLVDVGFRQNLGNNTAVQDAYTATPTVPTGPALCYGTEACGCGPNATFDAYLGCTLHGNAQGYRWRVVGDQVLMRNLAGLY